MVYNIALVRDLVGHGGKTIRSVIEHQIIAEKPFTEREFDNYLMEYFPGWECGFLQIM